MTTTSEIYAQSELSKKLIEEIANDIKATAERLYNDMNNSPLHTQYKVGLHETATWQKDHVTPKVLTSTAVDPLHKASDHIVIQKSVTPITTFSEPLYKQTEILSKPISGHVRSPSAHNANKKFDELIAKADLIISRSPRRDNYPLKTDAKPVPFDFSNLKTLPKSPVVASAFTETYNGSAKPGHTRHVSSAYDEVKIGDYLSGADIHKIKTEYQPVQITLTTPKDYKEEYKVSTNNLVSSHDYKSTPVYTDKLGAYQYETSGHKHLDKHLDVYKSVEPKKEVAYQYGSGSKQENKYYDHGKLDVVISSIAKRKGTSPEALKSPPKPHLKIVTEANPNYYYTGHQNLPEYIDRAGETFTQPATISLDNYKLSSQLNQYEGLYQSNKPAHAEYGVAGNKLNDPYGLSLSKLVERATLESGYSSALIRDDYNSMLLESKAPKKTLGYEPRSARSPERSIIERVEALENDLDSLYFDVNNTGRFGNGTNRELDRPVQSLGGYQGLYKGRNEEYGHEVETRHKSPYGGNEGLVYVRDLDKRRLHQGESNQGGVHVSNKERFAEEEARGVRREGNTWREEDRYRIQVTPAQPAQRERSYDTTGYRAYDDRREELARKSYERRDLTPESYRREYGDNVNRYSPPRTNLRSPIRYTNKTEQVTPTKSPGSRQGSGQKGTNKIERAFHF